MHKKGNILSDSQIDTENAKNTSKSLYLSQETVFGIFAKRNSSFSFLIFFFKSQNKFFLQTVSVCAAFNQLNVFYN